MHSVSNSMPAEAGSCCRRGQRDRAMRAPPGWLSEGACDTVSPADDHIQKKTLRDAIEKPAGACRASTVRKATERNRTERNSGQLCRQTTVVGNRIFMNLIIRDLVYF
ncbi:hypothetical protein [Burkholderia cenocepacia]|uniref:hypothetical protein n=1 Tax=Burkholderia cenocepacia TaxID=95486 RepID=UPI00163C6568|nr:hypothetical protein [Burkholderia cenocepacia]